MQALMDSVELTHDNGDGTAVRMARSLSPPIALQPSA